MWGAYLLPITGWVVINFFVLAGRHSRTAPGWQSSLHSGVSPVFVGTRGNLLPPSWRGLLYVFIFPLFLVAFKNRLKFFWPGIIVWRTCRDLSRWFTDSRFSILVSETELCLVFMGLCQGNSPSKRDEISGSHPNVFVAVEIHNLILFLFLR